MTSPSRTSNRSPARRWLREHLFRSPADGAATILGGAIAGYLLLRFARFVLVTGRWDIVRENLALFVVGSYERDQLWRPAVVLIASAIAAGLVAGVVARRARLRGPDVPADPTPGPATEVLGRVWPTLALLAVTLPLVQTITPWLVIAGALVGAWGARRVALVGSVVSPSVVAIVAVVVALGSVWLLVDAVGWDDWGGLMLNLYLAVVSIALCFPFGVLLALGRRSTMPVLRWLCAAYIDLFRGVPLVALLLMANVALGFFVPEEITFFGLSIDLVPGKVVRAVVVFTLFTAAYVAEIVRGGLQSIPSGQYEAGQALGMSPVLVTSRIVLPQALRNVIPALVGQFISLFKDTTLAGAAMGFLDLLAGAQAATKQPAFSGQGLIAESLVFVCFVFWVGSFTMSRESQRLEQRLGVGSR